MPGASTLKRTPVPRLVLLELRAAREREDPGLRRLVAGARAVGPGARDRADHHDEAAPGAQRGQRRGDQVEDA